MSGQKAKPSDSNFFYSMLLLPGARRGAILRFYRFCSAVDDAVDETPDPEEREKVLRDWEEEIEAISRGEARTEKGRALAEVLREYRAPLEPLRAILRGVRMDLEKTRYQTYEELKHYCDHVAGAVGVASLYLFGIDHPAGSDYAHHLGAGLQLINILRDVGTDADRGRIYLPREALQRHGVSEEDILHHHYSESLFSLLKEHAQRARDFLNRADPNVFGPQKRRAAPAEGMRETYLHLLKKLETKGFRVFDPPPRLGHPCRLRLAVKAWLRMQF